MLSMYSYIYLSGLTQRHLRPSRAPLIVKLDPNLVFNVGSISDGADPRPPAQDESVTGIRGRRSRKWRRRSFSGDRGTPHWGRLFVAGGNGRSPVARATCVRPWIAAACCRFPQNLTNGCKQLLVFSDLTKGSRRHLRKTTSLACPSNPPSRQKRVTIEAFVLDENAKVAVVREKRWCAIQGS